MRYRCISTLQSKVNQFARFAKHKRSTELHQEIWVGGNARSSSLMNSPNHGKHL